MAIAALPGASRGHVPRTHASRQRHAGPLLPLALLLFAAPAAATVNDALWVTDGPVYALAVEGHTLYVGGRFEQVGPATGGGVPIGASTGTPVPSYPKVLGAVSAVVADGAGGWFIGGRFTRVGDEPRAGLAHVLADGRVADWNPGVAGEVRALLLHRGSLYVGGSFTACGGRPRSNAAAVGATSGHLADWAPEPDGPVGSLAGHGSTVFAGGSFRIIGGKPRGELAALDAESGKATDWQADMERVPSAQALLVRGNTLYVGGIVGRVLGVITGGLAAIDVRTGEVSDWSPHVGKSVLAMALRGSRLFAAGVGTGIAEVDLENGAVSKLAPGGQWGIINSLAIDGTSLYIGSSRWAQLGGQSRLGLAALNLRTGALEAWDPRADGEVHCLAAAGGVVYAGGAFGSIGGVRRRNAAAFDLRTGRATGWNPEPNNFAVRALAARDGIVYAGGDFTRIGGAHRMFVAALDGETGQATAWNPEADCFDHQCFVSTLAAADGVLYLGGRIGYFRSNGSVARNFAGAVSLASGMPTDWNPNADWWVEALGTDGGRVLVGGGFSRIGGAARRGVAALDPVTGLATAWDPSGASGLPLHTSALAVGPSVVYAGGWIANEPGRTPGFLVALERSSGAMTGWNAEPDEAVLEVALDGGLVYAGGRFTRIGGAERARLAAIDAISGIATDWNPRLDGAVSTLLVAGSTLYAGGDFGAVGDSPRPHLVSFRLDDVRRAAHASADRHAVELGSLPAGPLVGDDLELSVSMPSGGRVRFGFVLPAASEVRLDVFDLAGRRVATVVDARKAAGRHVVEWQATGERSGVYFGRLRASGRDVTRPVIVTR